MKPLKKESKESIKALASESSSAVSTASSSASSIAQHLIKPEKLLTKDPFPGIIGLQKEKDQIKSALISSRHIILVGAPGMGKTTIAKSVANLLDDEYITNPLNGERSEKKVPGSERFVRVQGSPDLTAEDLIGDIDPIKAMQYGPSSIEAFTPGKIFKAHQGVLFFDEVNRCSEKLQNALLQVLEESIVTIGSFTVQVPADFIFIGTMNPDDSSTEPLSDVFLDRFDLISMKYPETASDELAIIRTRALSSSVECPPTLQNFIVQYIRSLRHNPSLERKPSVRASLGLYERTCAYAQVMNRKKASIEDLKAVLLSVLAHRISLKPSVKYLQKPEQLLMQSFEEFSKNHDSESEDGGEVP